VILVADRGAVSERTLKTLREAGFDYILGMRMRTMKELKESVLSGLAATR